MFKKDEISASGEAETIIGPSIKVKGNFHGDGNIIIEGSLEGSVKTTKDLFIGKKALITAEVEAHNAKVGGIIKGNLKIHGYLEIGPGASIDGDIETMSISIEKGATINGQIAMGKQHAAPASNSEKK